MGGVGMILLRKLAVLNGYEFVDSERGLAPKDRNAAKGAIDNLYAILTILDTKAAGLLAVNSIFMALLAVFLGQSLQSNYWIVGWQQPAALIAFFLFVESSFLCMFVVRVEWKFLGKVVLGNKDSAQFVPAEFWPEIIALEDATVRRTGRFEWAWGLSCAGLLFVMMVVLPFLMHKQP
jgi:hypothetical protein